MLSASPMTPMTHLAPPSRLRAVPGRMAAAASLPGITELMALLGGAPSHFHVVLVRVDAGDASEVVEHIGGLLQGRGCVFRVAPGLFAVQLPATMANAGRYLIEAITHRPPVGAVLRLATRTWAGRGRPVSVLSETFEALMSDRYAQLDPVRRAPPPLPADADPAST